MMKSNHQTLWPAIVLIASTLWGCADQKPSTTVPIAAKNSSFQHVVTNNNYQTLVENFQTPPAETKPFTWYHVMNSNMSAIGITKDFEAMAKAGMGGVLYFNLGRNISKGKILFNTEEHIELIGHMASEAKRLGMVFGIHNADGWSSSGGPWNKPEHGMKQVTWNETIVNSNARNNGNISVKLPQPMTMLDYYHDIAVLAYPSLPTELVDAELNPTISSSDPEFDVTVVNNIEVDTVSSIKSKDGQPVWLQFAYDKPVTIRFASVDINWGKHIKYELQYSNDGKNFKKHVDMRVNRPGRVRWALDAAFEGVTAKYFRIVADKTLNIFEAKLASTPRMGNYLARGQYLLRQGQPVADAAWYIGEAAPTGCPDRRLRESKHVPTYVNYDCFNTEKLNELFYQDGRYQLNHGLKYKALMLKNHDTLSFATVQKIHQFAKQGGVIIGKPIEQLAGRNITAEQQAQFEKMVDFIWSQPTTHLSVSNEQQWEKLYQQHGFNFDLRIKDTKELFFTHRQTDQQDIYFVYNDSGKRKLFDASFEVTGKVPELWDANTGKIKKVAAFNSNNGVTNVAFRLAPNESAFVIFNDDAAGKVKLSPQLVRNNDVEALYNEQGAIEFVATYL